MRVLVTRPERDAASTAARLAELGHEAILAPVIRIVPTGVEPPAETFDAVFATSAHALALLSDEALKRLRALPLFVVGGRTAQAARARNFSDLRVVAPDATRLAEAILAADPRPKRPLYLAGRDRKPRLEQRLAEAGLSVSVAVVYEAEPQPALSEAALTELCGGRIDSVLHFSRRSAALFLQSAEAEGLHAELGAIRHVCMSEDAAAPLIAAGFSVRIAATPDARALFAALEPM